jgi:hypothetical protein
VNCRVAYFRGEEFLCPCCGQGQAAQVLVLWLDFLRRAWGAPVAVNSACRCGGHNVQVGGSRTSRHLIGCAADIRLTDGAGNSKGWPGWPEFAALAARVCRLPGCEFRLYDSFIHIAAPREEAERPWTGGEITV